MTINPARSLATTALGLVAAASHALTLTFDSPILTVPVGGTGTFTGTLVNDGANDLFIAGDSITKDLSDPLDWEGLLIDDTFLAEFLTEYPGLFPVGASYSGRLFSVAAGLTAAARFDNGNFALVDDAGVVLAEQNFGVSVQAVPEPASMAALGLGLAALARRRRKAR